MKHLEKTWRRWTRLGPIRKRMCQHRCRNYRDRLGHNRSWDFHQCLGCRDLETVQCLQHALLTLCTDSRQSVGLLTVLRTVSAVVWAGTGQPRCVRAGSGDPYAVGDAHTGTVTQNTRMIGTTARTEISRRIAGFILRLCSNFVVALLSKHGRKESNDRDQRDCDLRNHRYAVTMEVSRFEGRN